MMGNRSGSLVVMVAFLLSRVKPSNGMDDLPVGFVVINQGQAAGIPIEGIVQPMDDTGSKVSFAKVDIYSGESLRSGKDRILIPRRHSLPSRQFLPRLHALRALRAVTGAGPRAWPAAP